MEHSDDDGTIAGDDPRPAESEPHPPAPGPPPEPPQGRLPVRERRGTKVERASIRLLATCGIIGIDVVLGAVLVGQNVAGWIVGLVIGLISLILAALLWSSRQL